MVRTVRRKHVGKEPGTPPRLLETSGSCGRLYRHKYYPGIACRITPGWGNSPTSTIVALCVAHWPVLHLAMDCSVRRRARPFCARISQLLVSVIARDAAQWVYDGVWPPEAGLTRGLPTITPAKTPSHPPALVPPGHAPPTPQTLAPLWFPVLSSHIPVRPITTGQATIFASKSPDLPIPPRRHACSDSTHSSAASPRLAHRLSNINPRRHLAGF